MEKIFSHGITRLSASLLGGKNHEKNIGRRLTQIDTKVKGERRVSRKLAYRQAGPLRTQRKTRI